MTTITFNTLRYAKRLKTAGVSPEQAEAIAECQGEIFEQSLGDLMTKHDLELVKKDLDTKIDTVKRDLDTKIDAVKRELELKFIAEIAPLKWATVVTVGGIVAMLFRSFMGH